MQITYDPAKRDKTLAERGLDFEDAPEVFDGFTYTELLGAVDAVGDGVGVDAEG